jgi:hypothetical protein
MAETGEAPDPQGQQRRQQQQQRQQGNNNPPAVPQLQQQFQQKLRDLGFNDPTIRYLGDQGFRTYHDLVSITRRDLDSFKKHASAWKSSAAADAGGNSANEQSDARTLVYMPYLSTRHLGAMHSFGLYLNARGQTLQPILFSHQLGEKWPAYDRFLQALDEMEPPPPPTP